VMGLRMLDIQTTVPGSNKHSIHIKLLKSL
jgi:hypothetical protein